MTMPPDMRPITSTIRQKNYGCHYRISPAERQAESLISVGIGCDCKLLNPLTGNNGIRVLSRLGRPTRSSRAPTDMIPTRAPSRAPFAVSVGITSGPRTCSRAPVGSKTRRRDMPGGTVSTFAQKSLQNTEPKLTLGHAGTIVLRGMCRYRLLQDAYYTAKDYIPRTWMRRDEE